MSEREQEEARIREVYARRKGLPRTRLYSALVPGTLYAMQNRERVLLEVLRRFVGKPLAECRLLDAGCGSGGELTRLCAYGFTPSNLYGIDLVSERVEEARRKHPGFKIVLGSVTEMPWEDDFFDLVTQYTMFSSILDQDLRRRAAAEMLRVLAPGGLVISYDMRVTRADNLDVIPIRKSELRELFAGTALRCYATTLAPPIARWLAGVSWLLCDLLYMIPLLRTHYMAVARKPP